MQVHAQHEHVRTIPRSTEPLLSWCVNVTSRTIPNVFSRGRKVGSRTNVDSRVSSPEMAGSCTATAVSPRGSALSSFSMKIGDPQEGGPASPSACAVALARVAAKSMDLFSGKNDKSCALSFELTYDS